LADVEFGKLRVQIISFVVATIIVIDDRAWDLLSRLEQIVRQTVLNGRQYQCQLTVE
jgi:hypothetical protein